MGLQTLRFYACCRGACCRIRGERRCNALLIHGSASIEPHSMKLIHVQAQTLQTYSTLPRGLLCVYVYVCVCGFVWMCVINDMLFFFFLVRNVLLLFGRYGVASGQGVLFHESLVLICDTHRSVYISGPNGAKGTRRSIFSG